MHLSAPISFTVNVPFRLLPKPRNLALYTCAAIVAILGNLLCESRVYAGLIDNFDAENGGSGMLNYDQFANFNVTQGSVDLIGNGFFDLYPDNGLYIDLNGTTGESGTIETKANIDPGLYLFSFLIGNNPDVTDSPNLVTVSLGEYSENFVRSGNLPFELIERQISVLSPSKLRFATPLADSDTGGIVIDAISITAVPEPSSFALVLIGTLLVCSRRRGTRHRTMP